MYIRMKAADVVKLIEKQGWYFVRQRGSYKIFKHDDLPTIITVPEHGKEDLKPGLLNSILKAGGGEITPPALGFHQMAFKCLSTKQFGSQPNENKSNINHHSRKG